MLERYPIIDEKGKIVGGIRFLYDLLELMIDDKLEYYIIDSNKAYFVNLENLNALRNWLEPAVNIYSLLIKDLDEYIDLLVNDLKEKISGKKIILDFSGGKDSFVSLIILNMLREYLDFDLSLVYVHMPFLEPYSNIDFVKKVSKKYNVDLKTLEVDRKRLIFYLERNGLPRVGSRWCTYLKIMTLRNFRKKHRDVIEAKGDRILEGGKRYSKMLQYMGHKTFIQGRQLNVVYPLTILDVVKIVRENGMIHPNYCIGVTRVACKYCPYKNLFEIRNMPMIPVEDEEYIETIAYREYRKYYSPFLSWIDFWKEHYWRYTPTYVKIIDKIKAKSRASNKIMPYTALKDFVISIWKNELLEQRYVTFEYLFSLLKPILYEIRLKSSKYSRWKVLG